MQTAELAAAQEKQMEVCDVCGAFLIVGDAQQRIDDHLMGKQHVGYARLKSALQEIMVGTNCVIFSTLNVFLKLKIKVLFVEQTRKGARRERAEKRGGTKTESTSKRRARQTAKRRRQR